MLRHSWYRLRGLTSGLHPARQGWFWRVPVSSGRFQSVPGVFSSGRFQSVLESFRQFCRFPVSSRGFLFTNVPVSSGEFQSLLECSDGSGGFRWFWRVPGHSRRFQVVPQHPRGRARRAQAGADSPLGADPDRKGGAGWGCCFLYFSHYPNLF